MTRTAVDPRLLFCGDVKATAHAPAIGFQVVRVGRTYPAAQIVVFYGCRVTISLMEVIALAVSGLSLLVAVSGTVLSNRRSKEALEESRKAASAALWSGIQEAVQRFIGFDPASEPIGDRLANLRIAMIALVDELDDWDGLDSWLEAERALGAHLGRQVMEQSKPGDSVDQRLTVLDPLMVWAQVLGSNLRHFRRTGYDAKAAAELRDHAEDRLRQICDANGWPAPAKAIPGLRALDN